MIVLVVNCGSSSLKYELFDTDAEQPLAGGLAERVGVNGGDEAVLEHEAADADEIVREMPMPDHEVALGAVLDILADDEVGVIDSLDAIEAVGHRVVHGGEKFTESVLIDDEVIAAIDEFSELAPLHNPPNLTGIRACQKRLPGVPQVAVFDTAFHQTLQPRAYLYGLPYEIYEEHGVRRYGFHGTSHRYVTQVATRRLQEDHGIPPGDQKIITCHLGNGCSMAAVDGGSSIDTTLGFTPLEGLLMGTRCGDLDPAIVYFLMEKLDLDTTELDRILNKESGLLGVSGVSSDMRDVKAAAREGNARAQAALDLFCYRVRKYIGAYAAVLEGLHAIVFTAGIGENEPLIRAKSLEGLELMGIKEDVAKNEAVRKLPEGEDIATDDSDVRIYVIPTDEELMIARDTARVVQQ
ncbi:MAG: acetate/propionate family kinase [Armatimonadota bacterium]